MRDRDKRKLIEKVSVISDDAYGETLYFRPYESDDEIIGQIVRATGEKRHAVAQRLLHLAIAGKEYDFAGEKRERETLNWLVSNEKHKAMKADVADARLERLEEHARAMETAMQNLGENSRLTSILVSEIYCITSVCMSYLNQIFTKIIEYLSPNEVEKKNSSDFANRNILGLVEHALKELEKLSEHHAVELDESLEPEMLYLFTKIETIKQRLLSAPPIEARAE